MLGANGGIAFHRPQPQWNVAVAGHEERWTGAVHPLAGIAQGPITINANPRLWQIFTQGAFNMQDQNQIGTDPGFRGDAYTGAIGLERQIGNRMLVGVATTVGRNFVEAGRGAGGADIDGVVLDAYAVYARNHFWTSMRYGAGFMDIDVTRHAFPGVTARAKTDSFHQVVSWGGGTHYSADLFGLELIHGPIFGVDYITGSVDGYTESGGGAFNLIVDEHRYGSLISEVGWSVAKPFEKRRLGRGFLQLKAGWAHEHLLDESDTGFAFETSPVSVFDPATGRTTSGPAARGSSHNPTPQNDYATIGLNLTTHLGDEERWTLSTGYETQLFRDNFSEHYGYIRMGFSF